jgi:hypothetical protein
VATLIGAGIGVVHRVTVTAGAYPRLPRKKYLPEYLLRWMNEFPGIHILAANRWQRTGQRPPDSTAIRELETSFGNDPT